MPNTSHETQMPFDLAAISEPRPVQKQVVALPDELKTHTGHKAWLTSTAASIVSRICQIEKVNDVYREVSDSRSTSHSARSLMDDTLYSLGINYEVSEPDLARIPKSGPVVVVANHPFGFIDGMIMTSLLLSVRPDVKVMANSLLGQIHELREALIQVNPFGNRVAKTQNVQPLRQSLRWIADGGMVATFPAGEVSHFQLRNLGISDPQWSTTIGRIVRITKASVLPIYFDGCNGALFQTLGLVHSRLRTAMLPREFLNKRGSTIRIKIGNVVSWKKLAECSSDHQITDYLRGRTYMLKNRATDRMDSQVRPLCAPDLGDSLQSEIDQLPKEKRLVETRDFEVYYANADQIPHILHEIGRAREVTFRAVGEGTGKAIDLDKFDRYYIQMFIWAKEKRELVGAYRLGKTDEILSTYGKAGLYTNTLFKYRFGLMEQINPALEMGRSFVRQEYQKSHSSLMLLWKGIGQFVVRNPRYRYLFGPVSITNDYQEISRQLMVAFLKENSYRNDLAKYVRPRNPFRSPKMARLVDYGDNFMINDMDEVTSLISDIETKQEGIPILLKQYLRLGGKLLGFNVDRKFSNVLDGLILVDLMRANQDSLEKYFTKQGLQSVIEYQSRNLAKAS